MHLMIYHAFLYKNISVQIHLMIYSIVSILDDKMLGIQYGS